MLGGVVAVFSLAPASARAGKELVAHVGRVVREGLGGWEWDGVLLAVGVSIDDASSGGGGGGGEVEDEVLDEWEDACAEWGLEFVHYDAAAAASQKDRGGEKGRNEFGERVGIARVREALEANDWSAAAGGGEDEEEDEDEDGELLLLRRERQGRQEGEAVGGDGDDDDDDDDDGLDGGLSDLVKQSRCKGASQSSAGGGGEDDPEDMGFGFGREDSLAALGKAILGGGGGGGGGDAGGGKGEDGDGDEPLGDEDIQKLERMMRKLQAVRDMTAGMPEEQRRRMAKQAVDEVMKEL